MDVVVAMIGWRYTGNVTLLERTAPLQFTPRVLLQINGMMRVTPTHLNDDTNIDFLALITQERLAHREKDLLRSEKK